MAQHPLLILIFMVTDLKNSLIYASTITHTCGNVSFVSPMILRTKRWGTTRDRMTNKNLISLEQKDNLSKPRGKFQYLRSSYLGTIWVFSINIGVINWHKYKQTISIYSHRFCTFNMNMIIIPFTCEILTGADNFNELVNDIKISYSTS